MSFYNSVTIIINIFLVVVVIGVILWFIREYRIMTLENRLGKYAINSINNVQESIFDRLINFYLKIQKSINKQLYKSSFFKKYAKSYEKYIDKSKTLNYDPMNYVTTKIMCSLACVSLALINDVLQHLSITYIDIFLGTFLGFFIPDLFLKSKDIIVKRAMENDLLKAITIMNNSFKSGRSIIQTLKIVSEEIDGPLKEEFLKMHVDLSYGLGIDTVFERFSKRVNLPEVQYITTSLLILNSTGGDIVKVFSSIEHTFFNNQKLKDELKNLTASANFLYRVLSLIPILFVLVIYLLDPTYFVPLLNSNLGILILVVIIVLYVSYIIVVKKTIRIKEY